MFIKFCNSGLGSISTIQCPPLNWITVNWISRLIESDWQNLNRTAINIYKNRWLIESESRLIAHMWRVANGLDNAASDFIFCWWNSMAYFSRTLSIFTQKLVKQDTSCKMFLKQISFTKLYVSEVKTIWIEKSEMQKTKENVRRASCGFFCKRHHNSLLF